MNTKLSKRPQSVCLSLILGALIETSATKSRSHRSNWAVQMDINGHAWFRWRNKIIATRITSTSSNAQATGTIHHCIMQWSSTCRISQQLNPFVQHVLVYHQIFNNGHLNFHISFFPPGEFCQGSSHQICTQRAQSKQN